jgi:hypothetical protein
VTVASSASTDTRVPAQGIDGARVASTAKDAR